MSSLSEPALANLIQGLKRKFDIRHFVETGTFEGDGAAWATKVFPSVVTIEVNDKFRQVAMKKQSGVPGIKFLLGDTVNVLPGVVSELKGPTFFWIDAHCGGGYFGPEDVCPLLKELEIIATSPYPHFIFIDDARAFVAPPPPPFNADRWPQLADVLVAARVRHPYYCVVIEDIIMCVPPDARPDVIAYCNQVRPDISGKKEEDGLLASLKKTVKRIGS